MEIIAQSRDLQYPEQVEADVELAKAWPRFWARLADISLLSLPVGVLLGLLFPSLMVMDLDGRAADMVLGIIALPIILMIDALLLSLLGTSPGKAIVGLKVVDMRMGKLSTEIAMRRNLLLYLRGLVAGIPVLNLIGFANGHSQVQERGFTAWDDATDSRVIENGYSVARGAIAALIVITINVGAKFL